MLSHRLQVDGLHSGGIVVDRDPGDLDDAGLDGVHQREVADHPGEDVALVVAGALEVVRRRRQVVDRLDAGLARDVCKPAEPDPRIAVAVQVFLVGLVVRMLQQLVLVAVVRLVVEHDDLALAGAEGPQHPVGDHVRGLPERVGDLRLAAPQQLAGVARDALDLLGVPRQERVVVDDLDLRLQQSLPQVRRHEVALAVVVVLPLGVQHSEAVADRDAGRNDEEPLGEAAVARRHHLVDRSARRSASP